MERFQLMDTYKAYKVRERKFTTWLKEAAAKVGYKSERSTGLESQPQGALRPIAIRINELLKLAKAIAVANPEEPCPLTFRQALRDVISQRKEAAEFYRRRASTDAKAAKAMEGHLHYIKVLEDVAKMFETSSSLSSSMASSSTAVSSFTTPTSAGRDAQLSNLFELLEPGPEDNVAPEEQWESEEDCHESSKENNGKKKAKGNKKKTKGGKSKPTKPTSTKSKKQKPIDIDMFDDHIQYELEEEDEEFAIWFLLYCFFKDFNEIRDYLQEKWCDYNEGLLSLSAVSVVTNTAFDMFQKAERELHSYFPRHVPRRLRIGRDFESIAMYLFAQVGLDHVDYEEATRRTETEADPDAALYEESSWVCLPPFWALKDWLENAPPGKIPTIPQILSVPLKYDVELTTEKMHRDSHLLKEFLAECCILKKLKQDGCEIPGEDELTKGITKMISTRVIPIWLVFACQVFVDIRVILEQDYDHGFKELVMMGDRVKSMIKGQLAFNPEEQTPDQMLHLYDIALEEVRCWIDEDFVEPGRTNLHSRNGMPKEKIGEYYFLRRNPLICGLQTFRMALTMNELGLTTANIFGATIASIHLYNAVRNQLPSSAKWPDMEALMLIHDKDKIFRGDIPEDPKDYPCAYDNATGVESMIAQHDKQGMLTPKHVEHRGISSESIVFLIFHKRYCFAQDTPVVTLPAIEHVLNRLAQNKIQDQLAGLRTLEEEGLVNEDFLERNASQRARADRVELGGADNETLANQYEKTKTLTNKQLLEALNRRLSDEAFELNFDYFSFHHRCTRVLRAVFEEFKSEITENYTIDISEDRGNLPMVPYYVFLLLQKDVNVANRLATIIEKFAKEEGDKEVVAVREWLKKTKELALNRVPIVQEYISGEDSDGDENSDDLYDIESDSD